MSMLRVLFDFCIQIFAYRISLFGYSVSLMNVFVFVILVSVCGAIINFVLSRL